MKKLDVPDYFPEKDASLLRGAFAAAALPSLPSLSSLLSSLLSALLAALLAASAPAGLTAFTAGLTRFRGIELVCGALLVGCLPAFAACLPSFLGGEFVGRALLVSSPAAFPGYFPLALRIHGCEAAVAFAPRTATLASTLIALAAALLVLIAALVSVALIALVAGCHLNLLVLHCSQPAPRRLPECI